MPITRKKTPDNGHALVAEYEAFVDDITARAADRQAVVSSRLAALEAESVALDGLGARL